MLNDMESISSENHLFPSEITEYGKYWYYTPADMKMREVRIDYFTKPVLQVQFINGLNPTDLSDIPMYARFIKIKE